MKRNIDDVPWWIGPLALVIVISSTLLGLGIYTFWCFRRGLADGMDVEPDRAPYRNFLWRIAGWSVVLLGSIAIFVVATKLWIFALPIPIITLAVCWHLPTLCYKQGLRVGAAESPRPVSFASAWNLAVSVVWIPLVLIVFIVV